jgi:hypothetical protein
MSAETPISEGERRTINIYRQSGVELWDRALETARERYDAHDVSRGEIAAQVLADWLGEPGPLDGRA